jgi:hypothetical protein
MCQLKACWVSRFSRSASQQVVNQAVLSRVRPPPQELDQLRRLLGPPLEALTRLAPGDGLLSGDVESVHMLARRVKDLAIQL